MKKLLISGFLPFGGEDINPSWEAVKALPDKIGEYELTKVCLPVVFGEGARLMLEEARRIGAEMLLMTGVAGNRKAVTPELVAINYRHARIPDNAGQQFAGVPIDPEGPAAHMTRLPIHALIDAVKAAGIPCALSLSAGAYVCNDVYWGLLSSEADFGHRGLFIHVPGEDVVSVEDMARAIALCAEHSLNS
jgi:pyroglutamyl-peptidase